MDFSPDKIRARFHELTKERERIDAKLTPLRARLDKAGGRDMTAAAEAKLRDQIKGLQNELYPVEMERAACARALGGKTGSPE